MLCMVPEIWTCHGQVFFIFVILDCFLHFYPLPTLNPPLLPPLPPTRQKTKKKIWKNEKTSWRYYHFTNVHMCTINNNHLIYGSWDIECIGQNFFAHLPPKHPNFEKMNKMPGDSSNPSKLRFGSYFHYSLVNFENLIILFWNIWVIYRVQIRKEK